MILLFTTAALDDGALTAQHDGTRSVPEADGDFPGDTPANINGPNKAMHDSLSFDFIK
jgi:hypothetical protein